jgi:cyanophycinase
MLRRSRLHNTGKNILTGRANRSFCQGISTAQLRLSGLKFAGLWQAKDELMKAKRAKKTTANKRSLVTKFENHCPVPTSALLVIGGKENKGQEEPENKKKPGDFIKLEVLEKFKELVGKREPVIEVITTPSSEGAEAFEDYKKVFAKLDITNVNHIHHNARKEVLDDPLLDRIKNADAFFFSGGDQLKLTSIYGGTEFLTALKERYVHDSIVIAGTSAGAMALSTPMVYAGNEEVQELGGEIKLTTGLEFLKDVCIDTHFVHRGRFVRMAQVIVTNPSCVGVGIEEDTAIIVKNGVEVEVIGTGLVIIMEGFQIREFNIDDFTKEKPITIRDLKVHMLSSGDKYEFVQMNPPHK